MIYGRRDQGEDGRYTATKWFVILFIPVLPLGSYRVIDLNKSNYILFSRKRYLATKIPLNFRQVVNCYAAFLFAGIIILLVLILGAYAVIIYPLFK